jgi:hypothetical protein
MSSQRQNAAMREDFLAMLPIAQVRANMERQRAARLAHEATLPPEPPKPQRFAVKAKDGISNTDRIVAILRECQGNFNPVGMTADEVDIVIEAQELGYHLEAGQTLSKLRKDGAAEVVGQRVIRSGSIAGIYRLK